MSCEMLFPSDVPEVFVCKQGSGYRNLFENSFGYLLFFDCSKDLVEYLSACEVPWAPIRFRHPRVAPVLGCVRRDAISFFDAAGITS
jgi:hypothetical protein